jgi:3D (Asp-Asp-Asp) domain-containing protein
MTVSVRESILTTISLVRFRTLSQDSLVGIEVNHGFTREQVERELDLLVGDGTLARNEGNLFLPYRPEEPIDPTYLETADAYRRAREGSPSGRFLAACFGRWWWKIWLTALLLLGTVASCMQMAHGAEGRWLTVEATAYCPCDICCEGSDDGITANGTSCESTPYGVAASPDLPFGTRVHIPLGAGYLDHSSPNERVWSVDDRGGALRTEWRRYGITRLDLRYRTHASAKAFGRRLICVYVVID